MGRQKQLWEYDPDPASQWKPRCYESHPVIEIEGGRLIGGNCNDTKHVDADLFIALDRIQKGPYYTEHRRLLDHPVTVHYPITNMRAPRKPEKFKHLCVDILGALCAGKTVHVGCIGGHGRTGLVIGAVAALAGEDDPIGWVRKAYCNRAIESVEQENFLVQHFGALPPAKRGDKKTP